MKPLHGTEVASPTWLSLLRVCTGTLPDISSFNWKAEGRKMGEVLTTIGRLPKVFLWCFGSPCGHDRSSLLLHLHHHLEKILHPQELFVFNIFWKFRITRCHVDGCAGWLRHEPRSAAALALQGRSKSLDAPSPGGLDVVTR